MGGSCHCLILISPFSFPPPLVLFIPKSISFPLMYFNNFKQVFKEIQNIETLCIMNALERKNKQTCEEFQILNRNPNVLGISVGLPRVNTYTQPASKCKYSEYK